MVLNKNKTNVLVLFGLVRMEGLEPPRLSAPDPKSGTATNYATSAFNYYLESKSVSRYTLKF